MTIKAVIFDLDGTITQPFFDFEAIRIEMGLEKNAGPILEAMEKMTAAEKQRIEEILYCHEQKAVAESKLNDGAKEILEKLYNAEIAVGVLTRNKRCNVMAVANKHGLKFDAIVDREDGPVKPDAFGVLELCRRFGVQPQETLVVGDYLFDLLSAKAAGAIPVLLANHKDAEEFSHHADFVIERLEQILSIVENDVQTKMMLQEENKMGRGHNE